MKKLDLQKLIRNEVRNSLKEVSVKKDDLDKIGDFVMSSPQFEGLSSAKMKTAIKDMHSEWKASASNYKNIEEYFDEMEEMGGEESFMENTLTEAAATIPVSVPSEFIKTLKEFLAEAKQSTEPGDTYYAMAPGKENALIGMVFSNWISNTMNAIDTYELMDNFDSDLELSDDSGMAAKLAKKGLLTKKIK